MSLKLDGLILAGIMAIGLASSAAQAAPALGMQRPQAGNGVSQVAYRCWWQYGERHCSYYEGGTRIYRRGSPDDYRTGSRGWWREMNREDRTGQTVR